MEKLISEIFQNRDKKCWLIFFCLLSLLVAILTISIGVSAYQKIVEGRSQYAQINTITVSAVGEVYAKPDLAVTVFSVVTESKTVEGAMLDNSKKMNAITDAMKKQGVEEKDLKTISFNIFPRYEFQDETNKRILAGYEISQSLQVKIRNMEKIGDIIQSATNEGANEVGNLQLSIDKEDDLKTEARAQAIEKAKIKARELASQLGVRLGKIDSFSENIFTPFYGYAANLERGFAEPSMAPAPQVSTGENKIQATVSITYEIH